MKFLGWQKKTRRERVFIVLTIVLVIVLASHPELRLFLPLIDAVGLDLLLLLVSMQILDYVRPLALAAHRYVLTPLGHGLYRTMLFFFGIMGPYADAMVADRFRLSHHRGLTIQSRGN